MRWTAVLAAFLVAGCTQASSPADNPAATDVPAPPSVPPTADLPPPPPPPAGWMQQEEVVLAKGGSLAVRLGDGWGHVVIRSDVDQTLPVRLVHDTMTNLDLFTDDGDGVYNASVFTQVFLFAQGTPFFRDGNFFFSWWGTPHNAFWPAGSEAETPARGTVRLDADTPFLLVVANRVPGYTLLVGNADAEAAFAWQMGPHPQHVHVVPEPKPTEIASNDLARVERDTLWSLPEQRHGPAILVAHAWDHGGEPGIAAGAGYDRTGFRNATSSSPLDELRGPLFTVAPFGAGSSSLRVSAHSNEPREMELFRHRHETLVGIDAVDRGAGFLVVPFFPVA